MLYRCLIVGLGQIGMGYDYALDPRKFVLSHARSFSTHPDFELIGGVDPDPNRCANFETEYKISGYTNLDQALSDLSPEIIVIATPSSLHGLILERILCSHIPKVIVCEKPMDTSLEVARNMVEICNQTGVKLFVNYMRRSEGSVIQIKKMIDRQAIQSPIKAVVWYSKGLLNNGSHMLNLLEYWLGDVIGHTMIDANRSWNDSDPEPDFRVSFEKGSAIFCAGWEEYFSHLSVELISPSGRLYYSEGGSDITWQPSGATLDNRRDDFLDRGAKINNDLDRYQYNFAENLALALKDKEHSISSGHDALTTLTNIYNIINKGTS